MIDLKSDCTKKAAVISKAVTLSQEKCQEVLRAQEEVLKMTFAAVK